MSKVTRELSQLVLPGDKLGVVEEFLPGAGTYEHDGTIYAHYTGTARLDIRNKRVTVVPATRNATILKEGATVLAAVIQAQEKMATVNIWKINEKTFQKPFTALLHISASSPRYERNMSDVCKAGDVIRARIIDMTNGVAQLTTAGRGLGVVKGFCSTCGAVLDLVNRSLQCSSCGNVERRRFADDYGRNT